jgi:hypothetical protein
VFGRKALFAVKAALNIQRLTVGSECGSYMHGRIAIPGLSRSVDKSKCIEKLAKQAQHQRTKVSERVISCEATLHRSSIS